MWCRHCRQDVPGIKSAKSEGMCCARCGTLLADIEGLNAAPAAGLAESADHGVDLSTSQTLAGASPNFEAWEFDQSFRHLQARVGSLKRSQKPAKQGRLAGAKTQWHVHPGHATPLRMHKPKSRAPRGSSPLVWTVFSLGLLALAAGAGLLLWSLVDDRPELWSRGILIAAAGQASLLLGLVLQLERIWQNSRFAARKLEQIESQVHELERTATMLHVTHGSAAQAFYAHMAEQANPEFLLADLQGQVDLLARSMSKRSA